MGRFEELEKKVLYEGTDKMKELISIAKRYLEGLNKAFADRDISENVLMEIDFPMFLKELSAEGIFENRSGIRVKLLLMNIIYIARHTWEFIDRNGKTKTGDDLHRAYPLMFDGAEMRDVDFVFNHIRAMAV